ncbi:MAG: penicillin-binding transpeptidase domain-containing protein, partial [Oscillospiraceae bacterium]
TAQTGQFDEEKNEYLNAWFAGFYPFEDPKYTIVVMLDKGGEGGLNAAPIFAEIINEIEKISK